MFASDCVNANGPLHARLTMTVNRMFNFFAQHGAQKDEGLNSSRSPKTGGRVRVARGVYFAAVALVLAFVGTIAFVIETSSREADRFSLQTELRSTRLEFGRIADQAIRDHADISYWDDAVEAFAGDEPDTEFVEEDFADLVEDHAFEWAVVVKEDGQAVVSVSGDQILYHPDSPSIVRTNADLIEQALARYYRNRVRTAGGFMVPDGSGAVIEGMQPNAYRASDGRPGLVVAQAILPETGDYAIAEGDASVLLAFKPMTPMLTMWIGDRLGLMNPQVMPVGAVIEPHSFIQLPNAGAPAELAFQWRPRIPRIAIMHGVVPPAIVLCALICAVAFFIVRRHVRALNALAESEKRNRIMASHDALTGLPNRTQFDIFLDGLLASETREPVAVMCIDLDRFKEVNDTFGHHAGDAVLRAVARRFEARIGDNGMVARIGGDEFIVAVTGNVDRDHLAWLGDAFVEDASMPVSFHGHELVIGASVGIAIWPHAGQTAREVITAADLLLYRSKGDGRGRATIGGIDAPAAGPAQHMLAG